MNIKQKVLMLSILGLPLCGVIAIDSDAFAQQQCGDVKTSIIGGDICGAPTVPDNPDTPDVDESQTGGSTKTEDSTIWKLLLATLKIMTAGIGIAAVGGIVYGSLLYTTAGNKPEQTKQAVGIITNVVVGLVAYALMYVFLNFLIPGGIFS